MCPQNQSQQITIKITINKANAPNSPPVEKTVYARRENFTKIRTKAALTEYLSKELPSCLSSNDNYLNYTRKSKKHKDFISLVSEDDFKSLARSLKVKNHVKLNVVDSSPVTNYKCDSFKKRKSTSIDFGALGDALIEVACEHFKEMFNDLSNGASLKKDASPIDSEKEELTSNNASTSNEELLPVHSNICCDVCHPHDFIPLRGIRYNCLVCPNFDLCSACEARQHVDKSGFGQHSYLHPMAKITYPSSSFLRGSRCGTGLHSSNDIVYDIPLENCNIETKNKLEEFLKLKGVEGFIEDVDHYVRDSERYQKLCSILEFEDDENDDDVQFMILMSILEQSVNERKNEENIETSKELPTSKTAEIDIENSSVTGKGPIEGEVIVRPKKFGEVSRIISLQLTNNTNQTIKGGELKFEFFNSKQTETVVVRNASAIKPGRIRYYNLGKLAEEFERINGMKLRVITEQAVFVGDYNDNADCILRSEANDTEKDLETSEVEFAGETSATESIEDDNVSTHSAATEDNGSYGSTHSMVLPSLPKESTILASSEYYDATDDAKKNLVMEDEDYDIISGADEEDAASDFEILSSVSSNEQQGA